MSKNTAVYVISHGRADSCATMDMLLRDLPDADLFLVLQDDEEQMRGYRRKYEKYILEYRKPQIMDQCDPMDNFGVENSALYPRFFVIEHAKKSGYDYAVLMDDDIKSLTMRIPSGKKLASFKAGFSDVFSLFMKFLDGCPSVAAISGRYSSGYIGGVQTALRGFNHFPTQMYFMNLRNCGQFRGCKFEDGLFALDHWKSAHPCIAFYCVQIDTPQSQSNSGGLHDEYVKTNDYILNSYVLMAYPFIPVVVRNGKISIIRKPDHCYPKIISERWKK